MVADLSKCLDCGEEMTPKEQDYGHRTCEGCDEKRYPELRGHVPEGSRYR